MKHSTRRPVALAAAIIAAIGLTGCGAGGGFGGDSGDGIGGGGEARSLVVSTVYTQAHSADSAARLSGLQDAIDRLRTETTSGWTGRQDDVTGYLTELAGGRWFPDASGATPDDAATSLLDAYGPELFGIASGDLTLGELSEPLDNDTAALRATQRVGDVPVLDATLAFTIGASSTDPRVNAVRGRVYPDLDVDTTPTVTARRAGRIAARLSEGIVQATPTLYVLPEPETGTVVWEVPIAGASSDGLGSRDGFYYIDAHTGAITTTRSGSFERTAPAALAVGSVGTVRRASPALRALASGALRTRAPQQSVEVTGTGPVGDELTANGVVAPGGGVLLQDITVPTYNPQTGEGSIQTFDAQGADDFALLPGVPYVQRNGTRISDPEALAAHAYGREVYDYYASLGRRSWDGQGGSLIFSVHYADKSFCNSFFTDSVSPPQMIYGSGCVDGGQPMENSELDIDTAGHEVTHGVINTSSNLQYLGQSGALNESFADYFGNVIGDEFRGRDSNAIMEDTCVGISSPNFMCNDNPEGSLSVRYMLNGATYDDYLFVIDPPLRALNQGVSDQDNGGVHLNSAVWNNVLWSIRTQLATIDGKAPGDSPLAHDFDKIVYFALTAQMTPSANFLDARAAIEQTIVDSGADAVIARVAGEVFDANLICSGCGATGSIPGVPVAATGAAEASPVVSGDKVAWTIQGPGGLGSAAQGSVAGAGGGVGSVPEVSQVAYAGDALVALSFPGGQLPGQVLRVGDDGTPSPLGAADRSTLNGGLAGSDDGAAWANSQDGTVSYVDAGGSLSTAAYPGDDGDTVTSMGAGGGSVGIGTEQGKVYLWKPGSDPVQVGRLPGAVLSVAAYGDRVIAVSDANVASAFDASGTETKLSESAYPYGAAMGKEYAVWPEIVGSLGGAIAESEGIQFPDTDLYLWSTTTGDVYNLLDERGQQGYPALSGNRLVWQDGVLGGDDVFTATIPSGL